MRYTMTLLRAAGLAGLLMTVLVISWPVWAQEAPAVESAEERPAWVTIDGDELFEVHGISGFDSDQRAEAISARIV
jgi:hypothetical protein